MRPHPEAHDACPPPPSPSAAMLREARKASSDRQAAARLGAAVQHADFKGLTKLLAKLQRLQSSGASFGPDIFGASSASSFVGESALAWDAAAHRCIELSRVGDISDATDWAHVLGAFAKSHCSNAALLMEAEHALVGAHGDVGEDGASAHQGLVVHADARALARVVAALDGLMAPCSKRFLSSAGARLDALLLQDPLGLPGELGVIRLAALARAFARARLRSDGLIDLVQCALRDEAFLRSDSEMPAVGAEGSQDGLARKGAIAELAYFCHTFGLHEDVPDGTAVWLVPNAVEVVGRCGLEHLSKLLPLLGAAARDGNLSAAAAFRDAVGHRLPRFLAVDVAALPSAAEGVSGPSGDGALGVVAPRLLQAFALARVRELGLVMGLAAHCLHTAQRMPAEDILSTAGALAELRVRHELLLVELAENLVVRHQRFLSAQDIATALRTWTMLRVPHAGLAEAAKSCWPERFVRGSPEDVQLLQDFVTLESPGARLWGRSVRHDVVTEAREASSPIPAVGV